MRSPNGSHAMLEVFWAFLRLGVTSFGGPTAHLGYFRREFVERRSWLDEAAFATIVGFCSVLPGPTSSQVGMLIGLTRAGPLGAAAAWLAFTGPSAIAMTALAFALRAIESHGHLANAGWFHGLLLGLTAAAAAVVAQAVVALARVLCPDLPTRWIALATAVGSVATAVRFGPASWAWIAFSALAGALFAARPGIEIAAHSLPMRIPRPVAATSAAIVAVLVIALALQPLVHDPRLAVIATIARAGTLVFGGGHVVLPLLQSLTANGLVDRDTFFAGYGLVQAMPGPLFTFGTFLGAANTSPLNGIAGALVATIAIFAPSFALLFATAPVWDALRDRPRAASALRGVNAGVVGLLAGVLVHPVLTTVATSWPATIIAVAAYLLITLRQIAPWIVVVAAAACGALAGSLM